jgi:hypothetical protein
MKRFCVKRSVMHSALALLSLSVPQWAQAANISLCALNTSNVNSCGSTDPQLVSSTGVSVGVIGGAGAGPLNPFLLFAIVPDLPAPPYPGSPATAPVPGTSSSLAINLATSAWYGQTNTPSSGYLGEWTSSSPDIYSFAGLATGNNSVNWSNLSGYSGLASLFGGTAPTSFSVFEYTVQINNVSAGSNLGTSGVYDLPFTSLALGTYLAAWGIENNPATNQSTTYASPFTTTGFVNSSSGGGGASSGGNIPEPATLALVGLGLLAVAAMGSRSVARAA